MLFVFPQLRTISKAYANRLGQCFTLEYSSIDKYRLVVGGDGRCDSLGYSPVYCSYLKQRRGINTYRVTWSLTWIARSGVK